MIIIRFLEIAVQLVKRKTQKWEGKVIWLEAQIAQKKLEVGIRGKKVTGCEI